MRAPFLLLMTVAVVVGLASCAHRRGTTTQEQSPVARGYIDLKPGWRIRAVTPVTKSGRYNVVSNAIETRGNELVVQTGEDFVGYEVSYYSVESDPDGGISIHFRTAEVTKGGATTRESHPIVDLFALPPDMKFARLLFLTRVSAADHDQGVVAATTLDALQALTSKVLADPEPNCTSSASSFCAWIPLGIAVQPEKRRAKHDSDWIPVT